MVPTVTLVVAMRNESASIADCLDSIAVQDHPADRLEVLVFDGESDDDSVAIATAMSEGHPGWAVYPNPRRIQAAAWNAGIAAATGDIVGIVSGHAVLAPDYVRRAVEAMGPADPDEATPAGAPTHADLVGGPVNAIGGGPVGEAVSIAISTPFGVGGARHHYTRERADVDTVFMGLARRETYRRFLFDESMVRNEDDELSYRLLDAGGRIVCDPAIVSAYTSRATLRGLWTQYFEYGRWKVRVIQAHPRQVRPRHLIPIGLVATLGGAGLAAVVSGAGRRMLALLLTGYLGAIAVATTRYGSGRQASVKVALAGAYPTMHLSYGLGMVKGLWQFRDGWRSRHREVHPGRPR
jgi:succinoglycan biosynthesis protein ExoA